MHHDEQQRADQHGGHDVKTLSERSNECFAKRELLHEWSRPQHQHDKNNVRPPAASAELFGRPSQFCNIRRNESRETQCHRDHDKTQARSHEVSVSIRSTPAKSPRITDFQQRLGYVERVPNRPCRCQQISGRKMWREGGQGGFEIRTLIAIAGATEGCAGELWCYVPIPIFAVGCTVAVMRLR